MCWKDEVTGLDGKNERQTTSEPVNDIVVCWSRGEARGAVVARLPVMLFGMLLSS